MKMYRLVQAEMLENGRCNIVEFDGTIMAYERILRDNAKKLGHTIMIYDDTIEVTYTTGLSMKTTEIWERD